MAFQLWMADVLRAAGLTVHEVAGWRTRGVKDDNGNPMPFTPRGLIAHETRGSLTSSVAGEINVMINGREGLAGPIAHWLLARDGSWHVVNSGKSNHVKTGWAGLFAKLGNTHLMGVEAQHATGEPWTDVQYRSYVRGVAAICKHMGWQVGGHFEHQPGDKTDPAFDMDVFRRDVANENTKGHTDMLLIKTDDDPTVYISEAWQYRPMPSEAAFNAAVSAGHRVVTVANLAELEEMAGRPKGEPVPAPPVDASELAAALAPLLPKPPTAAEMEAAAEAAVRRVLGAVDGATPAAQ